jgi:chemotaxis protein CheC
MVALNEIELDALREVANMGSGRAATALSTMLGRPVDISVPSAGAVPLAEAVELAGDPADERYAVVVPIVGDLEALVVLLFTQDDATTLCGMYGLDPAGPDGASMLAEVGNILGTNFINVLAQLVGVDVEPALPQVVDDMLGSILTSVLLSRGDVGDEALVLDSSLMVEGESCSMSFFLFPAEGGVRSLLGLLGL